MVFGLKNFEEIVVLGLKNFEDFVLFGRKNFEEMRLGQNQFAFLSAYSYL